MSLYKEYLTDFFKIILVSDDLFYCGHLLRSFVKFVQNPWKIYGKTNLSEHSVDLAAEN